MALLIFTKKQRPAMFDLRTLLEPTRSSRFANPAPIMKNVHAQHRPPSKSAGFGPSLFNFPVTTLAVSCTFFAFGCADRSPAVKDPETTPPPVTTAPVVAPPIAPSTTAAVPDTEKPSEQPTPTGRVADDAAPAREPSDATGARGDDERGSTPPTGADAGVSPPVPPSDAAATRPSSSTSGEEDVSAALRREVAEMESRRARQQPRGW